MKNVVLLTIDALRKDALGCYAKTDNLSPFIDSLEEKCVRFNNAHSTGPYTEAAFPALLSSSFYLEYGRQKRLSEKRLLISEVLKRSGITTAAFHSNPFISGYFGWNRGWDVFYDSLTDEVDERMPYIKASEINKKVSKWLASHLGKTNGRPFFLWVHYMDVHEPYVPERKYLDLVDPGMHLSLDDMMKLFSEVVVKRSVSDAHAVATLRKLYQAHVREVDESVKELFLMLSERDILKDTKLIITSDHGDEFGEHGGLSHDGKMYCELVNVPMIIWEPDRNGLMECDHLVSTLDIAPTIVHWFDLEPVAQFEGFSLFPTEDYHAEGVFGEAVDKRGRHEKGDEKEIHYYREGNLKVIYSERNDCWELYDLVSDPRETENLVDTSPKAEQMKDKIRPRVRRNERKLQRDDN